MKLYAIIDETKRIIGWEGTQADAKATARDNDASYEMFEVPVDKEGLLEFLMKYVHDVDIETGECCDMPSEEDEEDEDNENDEGTEDDEAEGVEDADEDTEDEDTEDEDAEDEDTEDEDAEEGEESESIEELKETIDAMSERISELEGRITELEDTIESLGKAHNGTMDSFSKKLLELERAIKGGKAAPAPAPSKAAPAPAPSKAAGMARRAGRR